MYSPASITISLIPSRPVDEIWWFRRRENTHQLEGAKDKLEKLSKALIPMKAELADEEDIHMASDPALRYLLGELQDAVLDAQDAVESLSTKLYRIIIRRQMQQQQQLQVCRSIAPLSFNFSFHSIKDIEARIDLISQATVRLRSECVGRSNLRPIYHHTSALVSDHYVVGREDDISKILHMLLSSHESDPQREEESYHVSVIPIIGMAGLGKTTLAQLIFNNPKSADHFHLRIWVYVTVDFNFRKILENIVTSLSHIDCNFRGMPTTVLEARVVESLSGQRFLIVLDDVWNHNYFEWEPLERILRHGGRGSRVVVTTRTSKVSDIMGNQDPYHLGLLSKDDCWQLFKRVAFKSTKESSKSREDLEEIGRRIVAKCRGLPLAVKAMAGLLRENRDVNKWRKISANEVCINIEQDNILPALKLSYDGLPSHLKQCFAYCALFPKGYLFDKKEIVLLWIAEGLIQSTEDENCSPEETGSQYFDELLTRSFFRPSSYDNDDEGNGDVRYEMHDLLQELAQLVSSQRFRLVKDGEQCDLSQKVRHVSLLGRGQDVEQPVLQIIDKCKHLRTFVSPSSGYPNKNIIGNNSLEKMLQTLTCIRVLDLSSSTISKLPKSIQKLKLLRYLDLSRTEISELPDTLCSLYNLQTLKLSGCSALVKLPKHFSELVNLGHLEVDERFWYNCTKLPSRMGRLTSLHNLHVFPVGLENGYGIQELKGMVYLTGTLHISKLENALKDAAEANLKEKESLEKLVLEWSSTSGDDDQKARREERERALEDLQPHSNLKHLQVLGFEGHTFPVWMTEGGRLQNLVSLSFSSCTKCTTLSIGQFPLLKRLSLKRMQALQRLLLSVFVHEESRRLSGPVVAKKVSNNIETLKIVDCPNLTELPNFPALKYLKIKRCSSIETLPQTQSLESLTLIDNLVLADWNEGSSSFSKLSELRIVACPKLETLPRVLFAPEKMEIIRCGLVKAFPNSGCFRRLQHLAVDESCYGGGEGKNIVGDIPDNSSLCSLVISNIPNNVTSFPMWPYLPSLRSLHIRHCKDLVSLSDHEEAVPFQGLNSLKLLSIQNCPRLVTLLPMNNGGGLPKTLECLIIGSCTSLETLGPEDVLNSLTSLTDLYIEYCPKIKRLPKEGVSSALQHLVIQGCPLLMERCSKDEKGGRGQDWPKIMHIPDLEMEMEASRNNNNNKHDAADECPKLKPTSPAAVHRYPHLSCGIL